MLFDPCSYRSIYYLLILSTATELTYRHMSAHNAHFFPPTLAILGGLVAQDVLRVLSRKDTPIANLLVVDSMAGSGNVGSWGMGGMKDDL